MSKKFETDVGTLAKKINPNERWGEFFAEVKKNNYFGGSIKDLLTWCKKHKIKHP